MVYLLAEASGVPIDLSIADNLYVGILTDTGGFRYSNTSSQCLRIAAALIEVGAQPALLVSQVYERKSLPQLLLLGAALLNVTMSEDNKVACIFLGEDIFEKYGATQADSEGLVNYPLSLASVEVALLFKEISKDFFKVSFRSKGRVNVAAIAEGFAGGGHHNAAGAKIKGDFTLIQEQISKEVYEQLTNSTVNGR
jgi:phosphoesterase RecJ-like protein